MACLQARERRRGLPPTPASLVSAQAALERSLQP